MQRVVRRQMSHGNRALCPMDQDSPQKLIDRIEPSGVTIYRETIRRRSPSHDSLSLGESPLRIRSEQRPQNPRNLHSPIATVANRDSSTAPAICLAINAKCGISAKPGGGNKREEKTGE
ncbi:hypothetical protein K0M31_017352 [Melipona bicolor]|uniref:Uncharacterized protein n=1 Tax=Melipona bicolor TaxID=60889 RepID=A0AA40KSC5_9HYME|nr:hypothetical protein K0M31_017352 [Melipona bicolor]